MGLKGGGAGGPLTLVEATTRRVKMSSIQPTEAAAKRQKATDKPRMRVLHTIIETEHFYQTTAQLTSAVRHPLILLLPTDPRCSTLGSQERMAVSEAVVSRLGKVAHLHDTSPYDLHQKQEPKHNVGLSSTVQVGSIRRGMRRGALFAFGHRRFPIRATTVTEEHTSHE